MNRRSFIGSVIGTILGSAASKMLAAPFFARCWEEPIQLEKELGLIFNPDYKVLFRDSDSGDIVQCPGVKEIKSKIGEWDFVCHPLDITRTLKLDSMILINNQGLIISNQKFNSTPVIALHGDTFTGNLKLSCEQFLGSNFDEYKDYFIKRYGNKHISELIGK